MPSAARIRSFQAAHVAFKRLPQVERDAILDKQEDVAIAIVAGAKARVRRRSHKLAGSIDYSVSRRSGNGKVGIAKGPVYWGHFNEYGTVKMGARPFMRPAIEDEVSKMNGRYQAAGRVIEHRMMSASSRLV